MLLPFKWTDIGSWSSVYNYLVEEGDNYLDGDVVLHESKNCLVKAPAGKRVGLLGVENLIIIDTPDGLLITTLEESANVKKVSI